MKKSKSNLDEMQEKKLLKIEHNGFWIGFWGLFISIYVQIAMGKGDVSGESLIMILMSLYLLVGCLKNGIWDRKLKPNFKTNLTASVITGLAIGLFWFFLSYFRYHSLTGSLAAAIMMFFITGLLVLAMLSLCVFVYKKRRQSLDQAIDAEEKEN